MERLSWTCCFVKLLQAGPLAEAHSPAADGRESSLRGRAPPLQAVVRAVPQTCSAAKKKTSVLCIFGNRGSWILQKQI